VSNTKSGVVTLLNIPALPQHDHSLGAELTRRPPRGSPRRASWPATVSKIKRGLVTEVVSIGTVIEGAPSHEGLERIPARASKASA
jgi:hypothetical protein